MKYLCLFFILCVPLIMACADDLLIEEFSKFIHKYNKVYQSSEEYQRRFEIFKASMERSEQASEEDGATFGVTKFSDMTPEEFKGTVLMSKTAFPAEDQSVEPFLLNPSFPLDIDWRIKGAVTPVKDQGQCGSCWAFSATEAIESAWILKGFAKSNSINLSPQQLVDCDKEVYGCNGGTTESAYNYLLKAGGQEGISYYPYTAKDGTCQFNASYINAKIQTFVKTGGNENNIQNNLVNYGPLSICVDAAHWQNYQSGVMRARQCCPFGLCELDHCVQLVGYNATSSPGYWIVRNSWAADWGVDGYIHLEMGSNTCGISRDSTWPTV
jgi:cathepsin F